MKICLLIITLVCLCIVGFFLSMGFCIAWGKLSYCMEGEDKRVNDNCVTYGDSDNGQCELLCYGNHTISDPLGYDTLRIGCWATLASNAGVIAIIVLACFCAKCR